MTIHDLRKLFDNKGLDLGDKYVRFERGGQLTVTNPEANYGQWDFRKDHDDKFYLNTSIPIIDNKKEILIEIVLNNSIFCGLTLGKVFKKRLIFLCKVSHCCINKPVSAIQPTTN